MSDFDPDRGDSDLGDLRAAWADLDALRSDERETARELLVVSELRHAWRSLPTPPLPHGMGPARRRPIALPRTLVLALPLLAAMLLLYVARDRSAGAERPSLAVPIAQRDSRLVADLTLVTLGTLGNLGSKSAAAFFPVACLCCEVLLHSDSPWNASAEVRSAVDQTIAEAIAADCRGEWSFAAATLAPILDERSLTHDQRTRASVAFAHASRQLGRVDDARRAEIALAR